MSFRLRNFRIAILAAAVAMLAVCGWTQSNQLANASRAEQVRAECVKGRRYICGKVVQINPDGLVVESGYTSLLRPPFHTSWVLPGTISASKDPNAIESKEPDSVCFGLVFLTDIPKRPAVKLYDYVVIHGYPAGQFEYVPVGNIHKTIRRFSAGLERAVKLNLESAQK